MSTAENTSNPTLYLIDGHAQIFRAYYAIRTGMTSPVTGEPTQAVFGFASMLFKFFADCRPTHAVMLIDMPGKTFRDELYPDYKAHRPPPPPDLFPQEKRIFELTRLFGIPLIGHSGVEADDLIATLTHRTLTDPTRTHWNVCIISKDKDLEQLLNSRVAMLDVQNNTRVTPESLLQDKGITPAQVVDMLALMGDTADNVPGVEGIGPKTATELICRYGSIEELLNHLDELKGKRRENLEKAKDVLSLSRQLVQLKNDVAIDFDLAQAQIQPPDAHGLQRMFDELGLRRHQFELQRFLRPSTAPSSSPSVSSAIENPANPAAGVASTTQTSSPSKSRSTKKSSASPGQPMLFSGSLFDAPAESASSNIHDTLSSPSQHGTTPQSIASIDSTSPAQAVSTITNSSLLRDPSQDWTPRDYRAITTLDDLQALAKTLEQQKLIAVDTETIGLGQRAKLCGISLAWQENHAVYIPIHCPAPAQPLDLSSIQRILDPIFQSKQIYKTGHNIKYDWLVLQHAGFNLQGIVFDSMIASHLLGLASHGLDALALHFFNHTMMQINLLIGDQVRKSAGSASADSNSTTMDQVPLDLITRYACDDAEVSYRLYHTMQPRLTAWNLTRLADDVEMPLVTILAEMQCTGIRVDPNILEEQRSSLAQRLTTLRDQVHACAGVPFNLDSPKQLAEILFTRLQLPVIKRTRTGVSTDAEVLEKLADREDLSPTQAQILDLLSEYRQLAKLVSTYLVAIKQAIDPADGRVHAQFHQAGAATGRLSSSDPNLQNIPIRTATGRQIRRAFVAEPGQLLVCADYSQIELRLLAHLSKDTALIDAFKQGIDIHTAVAAEVFHIPTQQVTKEQRSHAKTINFGIIYGVTPYGLARRIENMSVDAARQLIHDYKNRFPGINTFLDQCVLQAQQQGYVTTLLDRRRPIPQIAATNANQRALGERLAINSVVQGSAADLIKLAMVNLDKRIKREKSPARLLLQIHDELVLETPASHAPETAKFVQEEMEAAMQLLVPLQAQAGIGPDWLTAKGE